MQKNLFIGICNKKVRVKLCKMHNYPRISKGRHGMNNIIFVGEHARTYDVRWHSHNAWELVYCTSGEGSFNFENGASIQYREGDVVCIPPQEIHANCSQEGFTNLHLEIRDPSFPYRTPFRISDDMERHLRVAFEQAKYYYLADIKRSELVLSALGELIVSYTVVYRSNSEFSEPVEQIRGLILRSYSDSDFALDQAMAQLPFNYDYLRKLFKKEVGVTPLEYMTRLRMKKAEVMLTAMGAKDYSMAEIASLCGYDDALYFSRVFKKVYGLSPTAYVNKHEHSR